MCLVTPITTSICYDAEAGISRLWLVSCEDVLDLTFDINRTVVGVTLNPSSGGWVEIEFADDSAYFMQEKIRIGSGVVVEQIITTYIEEQTNDTRVALEKLAGCPCLHSIIEDSNGMYHYAGVSYDVSIGMWSSDSLKTGEGAADTFSDPAEAAVLMLESFNAVSCWYAPFTDHPDNITVQEILCVEQLVSNSGFGLIANDDDCIVANAAP